MAEHDLVHKVSPFCDPHLLVQADGPLDFLLGQAEYFPQEDILKAKVALLAQTKNVREEQSGGDMWWWLGLVGVRGCVVGVDRWGWDRPMTRGYVCVCATTYAPVRQQLTSTRAQTKQVDGQVRAMEELYGDDFQPPEGK